MAKAATGGSGKGESVLEKLHAHGVTKGVLVQMAKSGQLHDFKCEMPQCYHQKGRGAFDPVGTPVKDWLPSPDHYPTLKKDGGRLEPANVRLSHVRCNQRDYSWRMQIRAMLAKDKSLDDIAAALNKKSVPTIHGANKWTAASVRKAYVS